MEEEALKHQIATAVELQSLVHVMRSLAAAKMREYEQQVTSIEAYGRTIAAGLQVVMKRQPREMAIPGRHGNYLGAVVLGSDQGLCGNFNERIAEYAMEKMVEFNVSPGSRAIVVVGERPAIHIEAAGFGIEARLPFVVEHGTITQVILSVLERIEGWNIRGKMDRIALFYNKPVEGSTFQPEMQILLPIDMMWLQGLAGQEWPGRTIPTFSMDWDTLFAGLVKHHIFFTIYRAFIESLASENISRLRAMQAAQRNIDERLDDLHARYHRLRQSSITGELLDITTGYQAVTGADTNVAGVA
ncbi:MAG: F0F1 ATP synthase subunit gamma [Dehalococcoidia bacterium]|nr:F0F1 ATP synthase subunit gamma [Dehalococcoidia bacterium]